MTQAGAGIARQVHAGAGPPVLAVHATGFCKETWEPTVAELRRLGVENRVVAIDQRGHGDTKRSAAPFDWWDLGRDAAEVVESLGGSVALGIGHSSGGAALVMAELLRPGSFGGLVLVEPIVFPAPYQPNVPNPLSEGARRRRPAFPSPEAALDNFRGKGPFARWEERALRAYVAGGLRAADGEWLLKCRPEVEAGFYEQATVHAAWERLGELELPVVVVAGRTSDSHPEPFARRQAGRIPGAELVIVDGAGHFVPMEQPAAVAAVAAGLLQRGVATARR